jgi:hypothetical protein
MQHGMRPSLIEPYRGEHTGGPPSARGSNRAGSSFAAAGATEPSEEPIAPAGAIVERIFGYLGRNVTGFSSSEYRPSFYAGNLRASRRCSPHMPAERAGGLSIKPRANGVKAV